MPRGQPASRPALLQDDDFTIINRYQQEYRGLVQSSVLLLAPEPALGHARVTAQNAGGQAQIIHEGDAPNIADPRRNGTWKENLLGGQN